MKRFVIGFGIGLGLLTAVAIVSLIAPGLVVLTEQFLGAFAIPVVIGLLFCIAIGIIFATETDDD